MFSPKLAVPAALALLCACAPSRLDVIQVGPWFDARDWRQVEVFDSREQTKRPWGGIAIIHGPRVAASTGEREMARQKLRARKEAAAMGADGIIVSVETAQQDPQLGVYEEPESYVSALAIKYVVATSTPAAK